MIIMERYGKQNLFNQVKIAIKEKFSITKSMKIAQSNHGLDIYKTKPNYFNLAVVGVLFLAILSTPVKYFSLIKPISSKMNNLLLWGLK